MAKRWGNDGKGPDSELRKLSAWLSWMVPPVLWIVAMNTLLRDRIYTLLLPRRNYQSFRFEARPLPARKSITKVDRDRAV